MIDLNSLINQTFGKIQEVVPDVIVQGELVKYDKVYDRNTATYSNQIIDQQSVRCVFDSTEEFFRTAEHSDSIVSKIHVFGYLLKPVDLFDELTLQLSQGPVTYKTDKLKQINIGESSALHTFLVTR